MRYYNGRYWFESKNGLLYVKDTFFSSADQALEMYGGNDVNFTIEEMFLRLANGYARAWELGYELDRENGS